MPKGTGFNGLNMPSAGSRVLESKAGELDVLLNDTVWKPGARPGLRSGARGSTPLTVADDLDRGAAGRGGADKAAGRPGQCGAAGQQRSRVDE
jgi:hypothetical protein